MNEITEYYGIMFDDIKHIDENGEEFWYARDLQSIFEYSEWRNFLNVINKAKESCENSQNSIAIHFVDVNKTSPMPNGGEKIIEDIILTRYACYLIVQNGDSRKKSIALGQTPILQFKQENKNFQKLLRNFQKIKKD